MQAVEQFTAPVQDKVAKRLRKRAPEPAVNADPVAELRRLVALHKRWTKTLVGWRQSVRDRKNRETGETIVCTVPTSLRDDLERASTVLSSEADALKRAMLVQLRTLPIYEHFLSKAYGMRGEIVASYLIAHIKIDRCRNVSQLIRYCGNACGPDGKREIRSKLSGPRYSPDGVRGDSAGTYNDELKMRIWQGMCAMRKSAAKKTEGSPHGTMTKYLRRWSEAAHGRRTTGRAKGADAAGRRKATDLFLWDYYVVARTLAGLSVRPDKYAAIRGRYHNGEEARDAEYFLTLDEALAMVGDVGGRPAIEAEASCWAKLEEESEPEEFKAEE